MPELSDIKVELTEIYCQKLSNTVQSGQSVSALSTKEKSENK